MVGCIGFHATLTAKIISWQLVSWFSHTSTNTTSFPKPKATFSHGFCRSERRIYPGKKVHLNWDQTHNHQVMSLTRSPMSYLGGAYLTRASHVDVKAWLFTKYLVFAPQRWRCRL